MGICNGAPSTAHSSIKFVFGLTSFMMPLSYYSNRNYSRVCRYAVCAVCKWHIDFCALCGAKKYTQYWQICAKQIFVQLVGCFPCTGAGKIDGLTGAYEELLVY